MSQWHDASKELPEEDMVIYLLCLDDIVETQRIYELGYLYIDGWFDLKNNLIEDSVTKVLYWTEVPPMPD